MNTESQQLPREAQASLEDYFVRIRLARATELARWGRMLEAEAVLTVNGELPAGGRELDLLARLATHQGQFDRARDLWQAAIQNDPQNITYQECIDRLTPSLRIARRVTGSQETLLNILVCVTIAFAVAALVYAFRH